MERGGITGERKQAGPSRRSRAERAGHTRPAARILYISYDGVLEPLGQSQVLAYLEELAADHSVWLISFEKPADRADRQAVEDMQARLAAAGIEWRTMRYHKRPSALATAWDVAAGTLTALRLVRSRRIGIVHARSYVPALMALAVKRLTGARFLFDMRGFWADERVEGGIWPAGGYLYRIAKWFEQRFLARADHIVTLSHAAARELASLPGVAVRSATGCPPPVSVIPTCADLRRFCLRPRPPEPPFIFGYVGSIGTWYLLEETVAAFAEVLARRPGARFLVVNRGDHTAVRAAVLAAGLPKDCLEVAAAHHADVPAHIARMHAASALYKRGFSRIATAPTKLAEYLGCGVPCLGSAHVGDLAEILEANRVGVALEGHGTEAIAAGVDRLLALADEPGIRRRCAETAAALFSLDGGVAEYRTIYRRLASRDVGDRPVAVGGG